MSLRLDFRAPADELELSAVARILTWSFSLTTDPRILMERAGLENLRVVQQDGEVAGTLHILPCGQWFGGRRVPMAGIAAVAVAPQARGRGLARRLMEEAVRELRQQRIPLSVLYPATQALYRKAGYEQAGSRYEVRLQPRCIGRQKGAAHVRCMRENDRDAVQRVYQHWACGHNGTLDRSPYLWSRVQQPRGEETSGFVVAPDGNIEGYVYLRQVAGTLPARSQLLVSDMVAVTAEAARGLLALLATHDTLTEAVVWYGGPCDPLLMLLAEQDYTVRLQHHWMLRMVDVEEALRQRGYAAQTSGELHLEVEDELLADNQGRFVLRLQDGEATVSRGGRGSMQLHVRDLAAMYAGHASPRSLRIGGTLQANDKEVETATRIFAGAAPWMADIF